MHAPPFCFVVTCLHLLFHAEKHLKLKTVQSQGSSEEREEMKESKTISLIWIPFSTLSPFATAKLIQVIYVRITIVEFLRILLWVTINASQISGFVILMYGTWCEVWQNVADFPQNLSSSDILSIWMEATWIWMKLPGITLNLFQMSDFYKCPFSKL